MVSPVTNIRLRHCLQDTIRSVRCCSVIHSFLYTISFTSLIFYPKFSNPSAPSDFYKKFKKQTPEVFSSSLQRHFGSHLQAATRYFGYKNHSYLNNFNCLSIGWESFLSTERTAFSPTFRGLKKKLATGRINSQANSSPFTHCYASRLCGNCSSSFIFEGRRLLVFSIKCKLPCMNYYIYNQRMHTILLQSQYYNQLIRYANILFKCVLPEEG